MIARDFPSFDAQTVASQGNAVLGIRDSGKSYTAAVLSERFFEAGIPSVWFDPIGKSRFLRVPGKGRGYPFVVAGGMAGDLPLTVESAPEIMRAAMESGVSLVIDLYDMEISKADWRRIVASCVRVLLYENGRHGLRHIFIEEAAEFAPQRPAPDQGVVYAEMEKLARMGGNARLGYTLINQRSEEVSKAVLELCDNLFLHRQKGRNSLNALGKWLDLGDVQPGSREIIKSLPTLPQGECWAWVAGSNRPVHMKVPEKNSFEPDRRAMRGEVVAADRPAVDVNEFVTTMRALLAGQAAPASVAKAAPQPKQLEDKDVKESEARALRAENADLKARLARLEGGAAAPAPQPGGAMPDMDAIYAEVKRRAQADPGVLKLLTTKPEIEVTVKRAVINMDNESYRGRIAKMLAEGFYDGGATNSATRTELKRTGKDMDNRSIGRALDDLVNQGFMVRAGGGYQAMKDMKVRIIEA